jgi:LPPG:FO 2-phospho-L-lactate transferase
MIVLSGGTGTPKLLAGMKTLLDEKELSVVVNTAEDVWISGNLVSPDLDSVLYTLSGIIDDSRWWGIKGDSFRTTEFLRTLGRDEMLALGDVDRAIHIFRSNLIRQGMSLTQATASLASALGIKQNVIPMTDDPVSTMVETPEGEMHFQEFWVGKRGSPDVLSLRYKGIEAARPSPEFLKLLKNESLVLIGPSNPVTSIGPILALPGVRDMLEEKRVVAISPLISNRPVSGPAAKFMKALGVAADDFGVMALLGKVDSFIVSPESSYTGSCVRVDTLMNSGEDSKRLAKRVLELI